MPFGLQAKSLIVGVLIAYFVLPHVIGLVSKRKATATN